MPSMQASLVGKEGGLHSANRDVHCVVKHSSSAVGLHTTNLGSSAYMSYVSYAKLSVNCQS